MLNEFASWYVDRVTELVPGALARGAQAPADALVVDLQAAAGPGQSVPGPGHIGLTWRVGGRLTLLGNFPADRAGIAAAIAAIGQRPRPVVVLALPRGALLERVISLPLAAEAGLYAVLSFEMDRYTPFTADEVHWSATVVDRDREQQRIRVRILLVTRATLEPMRAVLSGLGLSPAAIESTAIDNAPRTLPLVPPDLAHARRARRATVAATVLCVLLGASALAIPFLRQWRASDAVDARIAALRPAVAEADKLRQALQTQAAGHDAIAAEQIRLGEPLQALAALTQLLPDDTFLTVLVLHARELEIDGQSASASRLIGVLSADPVIRNPAFAAPVTRSEDGADMFSIKAEVRS